MTSGDEDPRVPAGERESARLEESVGWNVTGNLLAAVIIGGGAGFGLDELFNTHFIVGIGIVASMALTLYYLWLRYGTH